MAYYSPYFSFAEKQAKELASVTLSAKVESVFLISRLALLSV